MNAPLPWKKKIPGSLYFSRALKKSVLKHELIFSCRNWYMILEWSGDHFSIKANA